MTKHLYPVPASVADAAHTNSADYQALYQESVEAPERFWERQGKCLDWIKPYSTVKNSSFAKDDIHISWYSDGKLNACVNCVDRHLATKATQTAIIWEGDETSQTRKISYQELHEQVCMMANVLKTNRVAKGDRVIIYMPMIPEAIFAMLACARVGAIHCVVFGGFSADSLAGRILDCSSSFVITADGGFRGGKHIALKDNVDLALGQCPKVHSVLVIRHSGEQVSWDVDRDMWWDKERRAASNICEPEVMNAEDPLFILYTSGSTGKPKGILHSTGGYLVYASVTYHHIFDYKEGEVYWCTADLGWITGHSYILYGPLLNAATTLLFEGVPSYPDPSRFWQVVDKHEVNVFYTAPTALRSLIREGNSWVNQTSRKSLRILGSVGEPINPEAWEWFHEIVGGGSCPIVDTWWQTETGGVLISPLPGATDLKSGAAGKPFFGVLPAIVDNEGRTLEGEAEGNLVILDSWPGQMRSIYGDHQRFIDTYFATFPGKYFTGDGAKRDADGHYWITGRVDDVLNVSGHRMGTAEVESALVGHPCVAEAAVVGQLIDGRSS